LQTPSELEDEAAYSQVSPMAVIALVLGLASPLAFIGPLFFLFPMAAIGAALLALGAIARSGGTLTGRGLAQIAIALGLVCTVAPVVRGSVRDSLLKAQAADTAQRWFRMLADGQLSDAMELLSGEGRGALVPSAGMGQPPLPEDEAQTIALDRLRSDPLTRALNSGATATTESVTDPIFDGPKTLVATTFMVDDPLTGEHRHVEVQLVRLRYYEQQGEPWRIDRWSSGEAHADH